jgi:hypothetical protein
MPAAAMNRALIVFPIIITLSGSLSKHTIRSLQLNSFGAAGMIVVR